MSGNVLEVRYKVISRQMECMNHTIATLQEFLKQPPGLQAMQGAESSLAALLRMQRAGMKFADWYSNNYRVSEDCCGGERHNDNAVARASLEG